MIMFLEEFLGDLREERIAQNVLVARIEETLIDKLVLELRKGLPLGVFD